jgi:hypothetical protein
MLSPPLVRPKRVGNYKAGPGRPPGRKNNATLRLEEAAREADEALGRTLPGAFDGDAHAFLTAVYKHPGVPMELRIMAAKAALRVEKPALSTTNGKVEVCVGFAERLEAARQRAGLLDLQALASSCSVT